MNFFEQAAIELDKKTKKLIDSKWSVGFKDRGLDHGDFGVITSSGDLVVECSSKELADHIVNVHNKEI